MEFKAFPKIEKVGRLEMAITQKIHGTNAQVFIVECTPVTPHGIEVDGKFYRLYCGSRTRWIAPGDDNYGFAAHVYAHKEEFIRTLGVGQHFGEWAGPGINSGEGLSQKTFILFDYWKFPPERPLPPQTAVVPVLYRGPMDYRKIDEAMENLKQNGSVLVPGFNRPEGIVISVAGTRSKKVFTSEESKWQRGDGTKEKVQAAARMDVSHLLQPVRLEKLLSRDERHITNYPSSLPQIATDYVADLIEEKQITGTDAEIKGIKKALGSSLFSFIRQTIEEMNNETFTGTN